MKKVWRSKIFLLSAFILILALLVTFLGPPLKRREATKELNFTLDLKPTFQPTGASEEPKQSDQISTQNTKKEKVKVTRVIDGDTIEVEGGVKIRYIGIDTPETVHPEVPVECFGYEATEKNKELVLNKEVRVEKDVSEIDQYGRLLRYVWVEELFVNDYLVRQGYAHAITYPPDVKHQEQFREAEKEARENQRGLWAENACEVKP